MLEHCNIDPIHSLAFVSLFLFWKFVVTVNPDNILWLSFFSSLLPLHLIVCQCPCISVIKRYDDCCWYHYKGTIPITYLGLKLDRFFCRFLILGFFNKCFYKEMWKPVKFYNKDFVHLPFQNRSTKHQYMLCRNYINNKKNLPSNLMEKIILFSVQPH